MALPAAPLRAVLAAAGLLAAAHAPAETYEWQLPPGFPVPYVQPDNPMSAAKVALGARLFTDERLSGNATLSCAGCHDPHRYFTDGRRLALGATGASLRHNTPTLLNSAYNASFGWTDQGLDTLEAQHLVPLTNEDPVEMGFDAPALARLASDAEIRDQFDEAFDSDTITQVRIVQALASYVRTLVSAGSDFDRLLFFDERDALGADAALGLELFTSQRLGCSGCHAGFTLSGPTQHADHRAAATFHRTGVGGSTEAYRAPTLRFVRHTAPYMHDGSLPTLDAVVEFYAGGGGPGAVGLQAFTLAAAERTALRAFLESL